MHCTSYFPVIVKLDHLRGMRRRVVEWYNSRMKIFRQTHNKVGTSHNRSDSTGNNSNSGYGEIKNEGEEEGGSKNDLKHLKVKLAKLEQELQEMLNDAAQMEADIDVRFFEVDW